MSGAPIVVGTAWWLPDITHPGRLVALAAIVFAGGLLTLFLPWDRWPHRATLSLTVFAHMALATSGNIAPGALQHYVAFYFLVYLYLGLTQSPGTPSMILPVSALSFFIGMGGDFPPGTVTNFAITLAVAVVTGEVLAATRQRRNRSEDAADGLLRETSRLLRARTEAEVTSAIGNAAQSLLRADTVCVMLAPEAGSTVITLRAQVGTRTVDDELEVDTGREITGASLAIRQGTTIFASDAVTSPFVHQHVVETGVRSALYLPLAGDRLGSVVVFWRKRRRKLDAFDQQAVEMLTNEAALLLDRAWRTDRLAVEVETDALTGLANRRGFLEKLADLRPGDALVLIDIDHFKELNDRFGHGVGDEALRQLADTMRSAIRPGDYAARYGGDEFAIVLRSCRADQARAIVERLLQTWRDGNPHSTLSAGVAVAGPDQRADAVIAQADRALYAAKGAGRDGLALADA
jgi:diguanylate cyclase (GGDEF)-like protein